MVTLWLLTYDFDILQLMLKNDLEVKEEPADEFQDKKVADDMMSELESMLNPKENKDNDV